MIVDHRRSWRNGETSETTCGRGGQLGTFGLAHQCILQLCPHHWMWDPGGSTLVVYRRGIWMNGENQHANWKNGEMCANVNERMIVFGNGTWQDARQFHLCCSVLQWSNDCIWKLSVLKCRRMNVIHCIWKWNVSDCGWMNSINHRISSRCMDEWCPSARNP